jgi:hypothetical protein
VFGIVETLDEVLQLGAALLHALRKKLREMQSQ